MFAMCKEAHPASGVEHAVSCRFFSAASPEKNLVVGGVNVIRVYKLAFLPPDEDEVDDVMDDEVTAPKKTPPPPRAKLECAATFSVYGTIADMAPVRLAGSARDALVLCFRDAKVSIHTIFFFSLSVPNCSSAKSAIFADYVCQCVSKRSELGQGNT
jgi:cleavage and polyadenylation specificity factor subunit 1